MGKIMTFTYNGYEFEGRQTGAENIVWLAGKPDDSERASRAFEFAEVAEFFITNRELPEFKRTFKKTIVIAQTDDGLVIDILQDGYNIVEKTIHNDELSRMILESINEELK